MTGPERLSMTAPGRPSMTGPGRPRATGPGRPRVCDGPGSAVRGPWRGRGQFSPDVLGLGHHQVGLAVAFYLVQEVGVLFEGNGEDLVGSQSVLGDLEGLLVGGLGLGELALGLVRVGQVVDAFHHDGAVKSHGLAEDIGGPLVGGLGLGGGAMWDATRRRGVLDGKDCIGVAARGNTILVAVDNAQSGSYSDVGIYRSTDGGAPSRRYRRPTATPPACPAASPTIWRPIRPMPTSFTPRWSAPTPSAAPTESTSRPTPAPRGRKSALRRRRLFVEHDSGIRRRTE